MKTATKIQYGKFPPWLFRTLRAARKVGIIAPPKHTDRSTFGLWRYTVEHFAGFVVNDHVGRCGEWLTMEPYLSVDDARRLVEPLAEQLQLEVEVSDDSEWHTSEPKTVLIKLRPEP